MQRYINSNSFICISHGIIMSITIQTFLRSPAKHDKKQASPTLQYTVGINEQMCLPYAQAVRH